MDLIPVSSSAIAAVGHDPAANELHVLFKSGSLYVYEDVSSDQHAGMMSADSIGSHFSSRIKPGRACRKAQEDES